MKRKTIYLLLCCLIFSVAMQAQTNTSSENAQLITPGESITVTFVPGTVETLWYKFEAQAGEWYEVRFPRLHTIYKSNEDGSAHGELVSYDRTEYGKGYFYDTGGMCFQSEEAGTYYISSRYNPPSWDSDKTTFTLTVENFSATDNRVCKTATDFTPGNTLTINKSNELKYRWYKVDLTANKYYQIVTNDTWGLLLTFDGCDSSVEIGSGNHIYQPTTDQTLFIKLDVLKHTDASTCQLTIKEVQKNTNVSAATATPVTPDVVIPHSYAFETEQWYKFNAEAGKWYEIESGAAFSDYNLVGVYASDGTTKITEGPRYERMFRFIAPSSGVLYLKMVSSNFSNQIFNLSLIEVNDQRVCDNAIEIQTDATVSYTCETLQSLWWKINLEANSVYKLNFTNHYRDDISVYADCQEEAGEPLKTGSESFMFNVEQAGTYYIHATGSSYVEYPQENTFTISQVKTDAGASCETAAQIAVGDEIATTFKVAEEKLWYKLDVVAGKSYEVLGGESSTGRECYVYQACGSSTPVLEKTYFSKVAYFTAETTGTYYIAWAGSADGSVCSWSVGEVTDNRVCANAQTIEPGSTVTTPKYDDNRTSNAYWYKINLLGGKIYEFDFSNSQAGFSGYTGNDSYSLYDDCNSEWGKEECSYKAKNLLTYANDTTLYIKIERVSTYDRLPLEWSISEIPRGDNRHRNFAVQVNVDESFTVSHADYRLHQWYKVELTENTLYEIALTNYSARQERLWVSTESGNINVNLNEEGIATILPEAAGTYYLHFYNLNSENLFDCNITVVMDNRSCLYPETAIPGDTITTSDNTTERWYIVSLEAGKYYEFDFSHHELCEGTIYTDCDKTTVEATGNDEKILFKSDETKNYYLCLDGFAYNLSEARTWSYQVVDDVTGDTRLCEYADNMTTDTIQVVFGENIKAHWYAFNVQGGKYYDIGVSSGLNVRVYTACNQKEPTISLEGSNVYRFESDATIYLKVVNIGRYSYNYNPENSFLHIVEIIPDGRLCSHPFTVQLNTEIPAPYNEELRYEYDEWFHFTPETTGIYEIQTDAPPLKPGDEPYDWAIIVLKECQDGFLAIELGYNDNIITHCGHWSHTPDVRFKAHANTDYKILMFKYIYHVEPPGWPIGAEVNWKIVESQILTGTINVSLAQTDGTIMNVPDANLLLYQKINNSVLVVDTLKYNYYNDLFESKELDQGTYLLYAENIGQGYDLKNYMPGWYEGVGMWQEATEIVLDDVKKYIEFRPIPAPEDIATGNVTISGTVTKIKLDGGEETQEDIDVCVYRKKSQPQGVSQQRVKAAYSSLVAPEWELVARIKTNAEGAYRIDNLPEGTYMVMVDLPEYAAENSEIVIDAQAGASYDNNDFEANEESMTIQKVVSSVDGVNASNIKVYPSYFDQEIIIEGVQESRLRVFNTTGVCVHSQLLTQEREIVQLGKLPTGIYYLIIEKDGNTASFVAVKK